MRRSPVVSFGVVLSLAFSMAWAGDAGAPDVAIVWSISGSASSTAAPPGPRLPIHLFDWLPQGAEIEVGPHSSLGLALLSGARYELGEKARALVGAIGLQSTAGAIRRLPPVPALPPIPRVRKEEEEGSDIGAIRMRSDGRIRHLYPRRPFSAPADNVVLSFAPPVGERRYKLAVEDREGHTVFQVETGSTAVGVPPDRLKPGSSYYWAVRTLDSAGWALHGESEFVTLSEEAAKARAALKETAESSADAAPWALLAAVDRRLGLALEALKDLQVALAKSPDDPGLGDALKELEKRLGDKEE